jgi:hypothetical protein
MLTERDTEILSAAGALLAPEKPTPVNYAAALGLLVEYAAECNEAVTAACHQETVLRAARVLRLAAGLSSHVKRLLDLVEADVGGRGEIVAIDNGMWGVRR